jgi:hypothetical protein
MLHAATLHFLGCNQLAMSMVSFTGFCSLHAFLVTSPACSPHVHGYAHTGPKVASSTPGHPFEQKLARFPGKLTLQLCAPKRIVTGASQPLL